MKNLVPLIALCVLLNASGCKKYDASSVNFKRPIQSYDLAVEGGINTFDTIQFIRLIKPAILPNGKIEPISNATVSINDGNNEVFLSETNTPGVYAAGNISTTNFDNGYTLTVDYNGKTYIGVDTLRQVDTSRKNLPFSAKMMPNGKVQLSIPKHVFGAAVSLRWLIAYNGINAWDASKFDTKFDYTYSHHTGSPNALYPSTQPIRSPVLSPTDTVTVYRFSMSKQYSGYLYNVFQETDWKNIFSAVPGSIYGNLSENGTGYFYCTDVFIKRYLAKELVQK